jgi:hypothetical protein
MISLLGVVDWAEEKKVILVWTVKPNGQEGL